MKLVIVGAALVIAAIFDAWKNRIPNWLTGPLLLAGLVLSAIFGIGSMLPPPDSNSPDA